MADLALADLELLWGNAGGPSGEAATAAAIALAESGGDPTVVDNTSEPAKSGYHAPAPGNQPEYSVGLWQINILAHPEYTEAEMLDPATNAKAAVVVSNDGADFSPWSTFNSGAYKNFLGGGGPPTELLTSPSVYAPGTLRGWSSLQQAVNYTLPNLLTQAELRRQATMRLLGNG